MKRREFMTFVGGAAVAWPQAAFSQVSARQPRVAVLTGASSESASGYVNAFQRGMREFGYIDGQNVDIVYRYADGDVKRLPGLALELVRLEPEVLVCGNTPATIAIKQATATIPIVNATLTDPIGFGFVASYARPGGQVTGILVSVDSLTGKQLELVLEVLPRATRIGILLNVGNPAYTAYQRNAETAAAALAVTLVRIEVRSPVDLDTAFQGLMQERVEIALLSPDFLFLSERKRIAALAAGARLPAIYGYRDHVDDGGLMSYGVNLSENYRRAAAFVEKILKGARPGDVPVETPTKIELVINLKAASALGLTIPPSLLARADEVIE
jgi:putative ABC transport system substrate-binding protein